MISYIFNKIPNMSRGDGLYFMNCNICNTTNMKSQ